MTLNDIAKSASGDAISISDEDLEKLHSVLLMILDDLLTISHKYNLKFILIGGSAIGALRHKGFIPWDDDIDIAMPRRDFERLLVILKKEYSDKYSMLDPQSKDNYGRILAKIRLKGTEYRTILERDLDESGIFIDIYTIENIPDNKIIRYIQGVGCLALGFALSCKRLFNGRKFFKGLGYGKTFYIKCAIGALLSFASIEKWAKWTDSWHSMCKNRKTKYVGVPADDKHYFGEIYLRSDMCRYTKVEFEGRTCLLPVFYDKYLRHRYGDYMTVPPASGQVRCQYLNLDFGEY